MKRMGKEWGIENGWVRSNELFTRLNERTNYMETSTRTHIFNPVPHHTTRKYTDNIYTLYIVEYGPWTHE